jgi:hypothetical protein
MWKQRPDQVIYDEKGHPPSEWFMDVSELNSEESKKYIDAEARTKLLRQSIQYMIKDKENQRKKK